MLGRINQEINDTVRLITRVLFFAARIHLVARILLVCSGIICLYLVDGIIAFIMQDLPRYYRRVIAVPPDHGPDIP